MNGNHHVVTQRHVHLFRPMTRASNICAKTFIIRTERFIRIASIISNRLKSLGMPLLATLIPITGGNEKVIRVMELLPPIKVIALP